MNFPARNQRETQLVAQNMSANTASAMLTSNLSFGLSAPVALEPRPDGYQTSVSQYTKAQFSHIQKSIQQLIKFPRIARKMGWEGKVVVEFIICKDGTVKDILTVQSSGFKALDKNAVESIKKAAPFPKPPTTAKLIIPVVYQLNTG
ncbi:MAG: energy transducer TonB [Desulfobacula sp.]|nr:energy transducer TonB [Desulfobacula sp.]